MNPLKEIMQWKDKGSTNGSSYNWHKQNPNILETVREQMPACNRFILLVVKVPIIEEHYEILEHANPRWDMQKIQNYATIQNGVEWREDLFELWSHFKLVRFHYSIDSIKEMNSYIRYPANGITVNTF